jgi:hypothetical protein
MNLAPLAAQNLECEKPATIGSYFYVNTFDLPPLQGALL